MKSVLRGFQMRNNIIRTISQRRPDNIAFGVFFFSGFDESDRRINKEGLQCTCSGGNVIFSFHAPPEDETRGESKAMKAPGE